MQEKGGVGWAALFGRGAFPPGSPSSCEGMSAAAADRFTVGLISQGVGVRRVVGRVVGGVVHRVVRGMVLD